MHGKNHSFENTLSVSDDIQLTLSRDVIDAMAAGDGPEKSLVAVGYAGWEAGQLEEEMLAERLAQRIRNSGTGVRHSV